MWTRVTALLVNKIHGISTLPEDGELPTFCKFIQKPDEGGQDCGFIQVNCKKWYGINHRGIFIPNPYGDAQKSKIIYKNGIYYNSMTGLPLWANKCCPSDATILLIEQMKTHVDVIVHDDIVVFPSQNCEGEFIAYSDCGDIKFATECGITQRDAVNYHSPEKLKWTMDRKEMTLTANGHVFELPPIADKCNSIDVYKCGDIYVFLADSYYTRFIDGKKYISNAEILKKKASLIENACESESSGIIKDEIRTNKRHRSHRRQRYSTYNYGRDKERTNCVRY